jgi:hypothetical protein
MSSPRVRNVAGAGDVAAPQGLTKLNKGNKLLQNEGFYPAPSTKALDSWYFDLRIESGTFSNDRRDACGRLRPTLATFLR